MRKLLFVFLLPFALYGGVFEKGKANIGFSLGAATSFGHNYTLFGVSGHYFLYDNLSLSGYYRGWFGASPTQHELSLGANYHLPLSKNLRPYGGVFVRENFVSGDYEDFEAYGVRGGVSIINGANSYFSIGYAYEWYGNCNTSECSQSYPEVTAGFSF